jgi:hypothetical protein
MKTSENFNKNEIDLLVERYLSNPECAAEIWIQFEGISIGDPEGIYFIEQVKQKQTK